MPLSSQEFKLPRWKRLSLKLVILDTVQKWNLETWYIFQVLESFDVFFLALPFFKIPKPTAPFQPDPPCGSCLSSFKLSQSGGKSGAQFSSMPLCPTATLAEKYQQLIIGTSNKVKRDFQSCLKLWANILTV